MSRCCRCCKCYVFRWLLCYDCYDNDDYDGFDTIIGIDWESQFVNDTLYGAVQEHKENNDTN